MTSLLFATLLCIATMHLPSAHAQQSETGSQELNILRAKAEKGDAEAQFELGVAFYLGKLALQTNYAEAVRWYRRAAERNHRRAQFNLGWACYEGKGVAKSFVEAIEWWRKAAEQHDALAQNQMGLCYEHGLGVTRDFQAALEWYRKAAEQGLAPAQYNLAGYYRFGKGGLQTNEVQAVNWYRKAAEQNNAMSQYNLGVCYSEGTGVAKSAEEAVKWWRKAAEQNYALAQHNLGNSYRNGEGAARSYTEAVAWYRKASEQGFAFAQNDLAVCYANGLGVNKDEVEAYKWSLLAAGQGDELAKRFMAKLEQRLARHQIAQGQKLAGGFKPVDLPLAVTRPGAFDGRPGAGPLAQAGSGEFKPTLSDPPPNEHDNEPLTGLHAKAEAGDAQSQNELGEAFYTGRSGVRRDAVAAVQWFRQAAEQNLAAAQFNLGICYEHGDGVAKYEAEAYKWYLLAAAQREAKAKRNASMLELMLSQEQVADGKRRADAWLQQQGRAGLVPEK